jgi:hypothetical protein
MMQDKLKEVIVLLQSGKNEQARQILKGILEIDPKNEAAWIWLSQAVATEEERRYCLEQLFVRNWDDKPAPKTSLATMAEKEKALIERSKRRFTAEDIKAIRETYYTSTLGFLVGKNARPSKEVTKWHDLNQAQVFAIRSLAGKCNLSDDEVASKLHLLTDDLETVQDVADVYGLEIKTYG